MNSVNIIGRVAKDIAIRWLASGKAVCEIDIAIPEKVKGEDKTIWVSCTAWDKTAELASEYLGKGDQVGISGRLKLDEWNDKTSGQKRSKLGIVIDRLTLIGSRKESAPDQAADTRAEGPQDDDENPFS